MDLEEEREDSTPMPGKIGNLAEETTSEEENENPISNKPTMKRVVLAPNHPYPKCLLYKW
jgi:hypothetical protein